MRHYRLVYCDLLDFAGLRYFAYITSVFIGYIGTDSIGSLIKRFAAKKAGVEDGEINNQCKAFLDMRVAGGN
ncbi:phage holin family protein [Mycolicibacterium fortuitum]|uniref:phage holin family protein n=1 Tax=Mycolicibacterium fortuitum TaxID=1766 RepID=UPI003AB0C27A